MLMLFFSIKFNKSARSAAKPSHLQLEAQKPGNFLAHQVFRGRGWVYIHLDKPASRIIDDG
ncbi:hypothetical protein M595_5897 [Lyngbya aestuarii BL J]|uniref:Uncharacterized protein n=1 Tax=Lyngbya aestuarii BL J TaxID=1348334 RepID=U7QAU6_9CYAN|nr:hypothetical protein M595_5897 [Lyngbya aestuarii BL J]